ncbi:MAG: threonine synthase [Promethearchaeati archaeon]
MLNNHSLLNKIVCTECGSEYNITDLHNLCTSCGKVLFPQYDLEKAKEFLSKDQIQQKKVYNIWRLNEIMPVNNSKYRISLGEGWTPIIKINNYGKSIGLNNLYIKDEGQNPTGTFKSRGLCAAVSKGLELGVKDFVMPSAGNAGAALSAYTAHAGVNAHIFAPKDAPEFILKEIEVMGGDLVLVDGLIDYAGEKAKIAQQENGWFSVSTLKEPYRVEGKKTMGLELAEQFDWTLPDVIIYPTGGGTGIVGMWKVFSELEKLGLIGSERPRMVSVQPTGCQPIVRAFKEGKKYATKWEDAHSFAGGIRVPSAIGDYLILEALKQSNGTAIAVPDSDIKIAMYDLARIEGIMLCPEAAATVDAAKKLVERGFLDSDENVVLFGTGSGLITPNDW